MFKKERQQWQSELERQNTEIQELKAQIDGLDSKLKECTEAYQKDESRIAYLEELLQTYESALINIRNNNAQIALLEQNMQRSIIKLKKLESSAINQTVTEIKGNSQEKTPVSAASVSGDSYTSIDYFDFENHFRGSREIIKERQAQYLPYFTECKKVVDIGCGRGEFLELLKDNGIGAVGVDTYDEFAEYCKEKGLEAVCDDGSHYLKHAESTDGIFVGQVVEHLKVEQIVELCTTAYEKLEKGKYLIIETPNPTSLAIYTHAFYVDPSHVKPVHPLTMEYFLQKAGFSEIKIVYTQCSKLDIEIPQLHGENIENLEAFNQAMQTVSETLFGSQDYAIIAKK